MKNKKIFVISFIVIVILLLSILGVIYFNRNNEINDYTVFSEEEVIYQRFVDLLDEDNKYNYSFNDQNSEKRILIRVIDVDLKPISEAVFGIYDDEGYLILEQKANNNGEIAISNFEFDTRYYLKQKSTRDGLIIDETMYSLTITPNDTTFYLNIVNSEEELTKEEKNDYINEFKEKRKKENSIEKVEEDVSEDKKNIKMLYSDEFKKEDTAALVNEYTYFLLKDKLEGLKLIFTIGSYVDKGDYVIATGNVRIPGSEIKEVTIEEVNDKNNIAEIMDINENVRNTFFDGEQYVFKIYKNGRYMDRLHKFYITFKYNGETYKIAKTIDLNVYNNSYSGTIEALFYDVENKSEPWTNGEVRLDKLEENSEKFDSEIGKLKTGTEGKITFYYVPQGKYKITRIIDGKDYDSKIINVKRNEITKVEF